MKSRECVGSDHRNSTLLGTRKPLLETVIHHSPHLIISIFHLDLWFSDGFKKYKGKLSESSIHPEFSLAHNVISIHEPHRQP